MTVPITHPLKQAEMCCFHPNIPVLAGVLGPRCWSVPWEVGLGQFQVSVGTQLSLTRPTGLDGQALACRAQRGRGLRGLGTQCWPLVRVGADSFFTWLSSVAPTELQGHGSGKPSVHPAGSLPARAVAALTAPKHEGECWQVVGL